MSRQDDLAAAALAGLVGGELKTLESKMISRSSTDLGNQLDPRDFLKGVTKPTKQNTTFNNVIPKESIIEEPKSTPRGSEIVGVESVNINDLLIPMTGIDKKTKEAIKVYSGIPTSVPSPVRAVNNKPILTPGKIEIHEKSAISINSNNKDIMKLLEEINSKLDLLLKRAKIKPRYKIKE